MFKFALFSIQFIQNSYFLEYLCIVSFCWPAPYTRADKPLADLVQKAQKQAYTLKLHDFLKLLSSLIDLQICNCYVCTYIHTLLYIYIYMFIFFQVLIYNTQYFVFINK